MKIILVICFAMLMPAGSHSQTQFIHKATRENNYCNGTCTILDHPDLNNNPVAILMVTPVLERGLNLNPHPIGVYYIKDQWSIFNLDQTSIAPGSTFQVEYVSKPDENHFQFIVTPENLQKDGSALIDHFSLNDNPKVQFRLVVSWLPGLLGGLANRDEVSTQFNTNTGKWQVKNINQKSLFRQVTYNIVISSRSSAEYKAVQVPELLVTPSPELLVKPIPCNCPPSLPPNGSAGGDLGGMYPGPTVQKLMGRNLSNQTPSIGQVLKWNGTEWAPASETINPGAVPNGLFSNIIEMTQSGASIQSSPVSLTLPGMGSGDLSLSIPATSKLILSVTGDMESISCFACGTTYGMIKTQIDKNGVGMGILEGYGSAANGSKTTLTSGIKVFTVPPGTYTFLSYGYISGGPATRFTKGKLLYTSHTPITHMI